jgi:hypothetical protein
MADAFDQSCQVAVGLLPRYLDDGLPEGQAVRLEQHVMVCPGCRTYLAQLRRTIGAVSGLRRDRPRTQVWERVAACLGMSADGGEEPTARVVAYKFLSADRISPFAGVRWPEPGTGWVLARAEVGACRRAVHACRATDLAYWLGERLWRVELTGGITEAPSKIVAGRGRLLDPVDGWPGCSEAFIQDCAARLKQLLSQAEDQHLGRAAGFLTAYEKELLGDSDPASVSYTTAHAAGIVGWTEEEARAAKASDEVSAFDSERHRQSRWLADRLGLTP